MRLTMILVCVLVCLFIVSVKSQDGGENNNPSDNTDTPQELANDDGTIKNSEDQVIPSLNDEFNQWAEQLTLNFEE
jgi:hypothetical protein